MGAAAARPSLADGEVDEEVDASVGRETCIMWVGGAAAAAAGGGADANRKRPWMGARRLGRAVHGAFHAVSGSWQRRDLVGDPSHNRRAASVRDLVVQVCPSRIS